ncbi:hypothetical protein [Pseudactinotalea sp. Z1748]|uniref:hypothetical protein n=1 Tax=Pseudactinotalea sp. Z1748 TaxID=3413027 RepID=UPI003C7E90E5
MTTALPIPIEFDLPTGWSAVSPEEVGATPLAHVALHDRAQGRFRANITIAGGLRADSQAGQAGPAGPAELEELGEAAFARLAQGAGATMVQRRAISPHGAPGLAQVVQVSTAIEGGPIDLTQGQAYLHLTDPQEPGRQMMVEIVLTCLAEDSGELLPQFEELVASVRPTR